MLLGAPLGAGTPHWCARSIIGHDSPVFQHGELFSGAAGATRLMRIVRRQALPAKPARTRCIAAGSQHYERPMSTLPDWPGAQHHPTAPLAGESLQRNWFDGPMEPLNAFGSLASAAANAPPGRLFRSNWHAVCLRGFQHVRPTQKPGKQRGLLRSGPYPLRGLSFCPNFPFSGTNLRL